MSNGQESIELSLSPDEANRIIHSARKVRYGTACWPCRQRKVKCDNKQPCENCENRNHANLCSYNPKQHHGSLSTTAKVKPRVGKQKVQNSPGLTPESISGVKRPHSPDSENSPRDDRWPRPTDEEETSESRYLGQNSIAALIREETRVPSAGGDQDVIRQDIMPILGLQISTAPYPFMSTEHMGQIRQDISMALPSDREILKTFQIYKQIVQPFWGLLTDVEEFESKLCVYLEDRASSSTCSPSSKGVSPAWLAMLFSVLAVATNYSELSYHKRVATSQAYVHASFHCLRLANYLIRPSPECLQALVILGFVLSNDMKAEASWALMGLTCRLAQALGLHRAPNEYSRNQIPTGSDLPKRKLWWTILWQDSLLSLSFDRSPIATMTRCQLPLGDRALIEGFSYLEMMYHLCAKVMESLNNDSSRSDFNRIMADSNEVEDLRKRVKASFREKNDCKTVQDLLQHYAARLHTSFVISVLCRPSLRRGELNGMTSEEKESLAEHCKRNLVETVRMYLKMYSLSVIPTRSWAFTYHGLSSAVLLGIIGHTKTDPEVRQLQGDLITALSTTTAKDQTSSSLPATDKDIELSGPLSRALEALKNIYGYGWVHDSRGPNTPKQQYQDHDPTQPQNQTSFEHQDAALAMASLQNGLIPPPMDYSMMSSISDMQSVEQTMNMSPMDLFDSIFWEHYPIATLDQIGFDFTQQLFPPFEQQKYNS
ncbi:fungal-specific transcription factor domain-containing protein [Calycina marina]|uniref:Fungal-specific transcription factor domain-containing protein n=1 Tax=Calycina marina TaxID=1763456 RepID=A0A9P8CGX9_9HELO|nr:fungal-specific transcription factor domain-containing protein [Calycina marina]